MAANIFFEKFIAGIKSIFHIYRDRKRWKTLINDQSDSDKILRCDMGYQPRKGKDPVRPPKGGTGQSGS